MFEWVTFYLNFLYNALYTWRVPGLNIRFIYFFVILALATVLIRVVMRLLGSPSSFFRSNAKKSKGSDD